MFRGSLPADVQAIVADHVRSWRGEEVYVGCSGNFTVERTLTTIGRPLQIHSNDVLLYSSMIGGYYSGKPMTVRPTDEAVELLPFLETSMIEPASALATVLLCSRLAPALGKDNDYYAKLRGAFVSQWERMLAATVERVQTLGLVLASYTPQDVITWEVPPDAAMISYPPFTTAASAFARDFQKLEHLFEWDEAPSYAPLDEKRLQAFYDTVAGRDEWMLGVNEPIDRLHEHLRGKSRTTNRGVPIYVYGATGAARLVAVNQPTEPVLVPRLRAGDEIGNRMSLAELTLGQFSALRSQYMNRHIRPGQPSLPVAVLVDGIMVGAFAYGLGPTLAHWPQLSGPVAYLLSDFPVADTDYKHLAKLIVRASITKEARMLCERYARKRYRSMVTTAFTAKPVSMKYRGVLQLVKREENDALQQDWARGANLSDAYYAQPYELSYGAPLGEYTLQEALDLWKRRNATKREAVA